MEIVTKTELKYASLSVKLVDGGSIGIKLAYQCFHCEGKGEPCRTCSNGEIVEHHTAQSLRDRVGDANYAALAARLSAVLPVSMAVVFKKEFACEHGTPGCPGYGDKHACRTHEKG